MIRSWGWASNLIVAVCAAMVLTVPIGALPALSVRHSNSLGQDLGPWEGQRWRLELDGQRSRLYDEEHLIWQQELLDRGGQSIIRRWEGEALEPTVWVLVDGLLIQRQDGDQLIRYTYDQEGRLEMTTRFIEEAVTQVEIYTYRPPSSALATAVTLGDDESVRSFITSEGERQYLYSGSQISEVYRTLANGVEVIERLLPGQRALQHQLIFQEDGSYLIEGLNESEHYNAQGLLIEKRGPTSTTKYRYNEEDALVWTQTQTDDLRTVTTHFEEDGKSMVEERIGTVMTKRVLHEVDGSRIETLYSGGKPYSDVSYAPSSNVVRSIRYH